MTASPPRAGPEAPSLIGRVLRRVLIPLALTWMAGSLAVLVVASHFTGLAFDRALLDDAFSISANVHATERGIELQLSPSEVNSVLIDQAENVQFAVLRADGSLLAGQPGLDAPSPEDGARHRFSDLRGEGRDLRAVVLAHGGPTPFRVVIAQTTRTRRELLVQMVLFSMVPQLLLLGLLAAWLWRGIRQELRPLDELRGTLSMRGVRDLAPIPVARSSRELEQLGDTLNAMLERLGHSVRAQREFAGNVAHELRTPLAGIRALSEYGLAHASPAVWREQLQQITQSQARASHLVDQLLALALADEMHAGLRLAPVRLDKLVEGAVMRHLRRADAIGVDLGAQGLEEAVTVEADAGLIDGILDNLVDNALRYGGRTLTIAIEGCTLSVIDDGPGIADAEIKGLTARWAQGPAGLRSGHGTGLGLSIVARHAELLRVELDFARASPAGGLRVSLRFAQATRAALPPQASAG